MAVVAAVAAVVGAGAAIAGTIISARAQAKAAGIQKQQRNLEANRRRRQSVREARLARGRVINTAALTGTSGSSGEAGATGSISSQLASNLSFLDEQVGLGNALAEQQGKAATFGSISKIGLSLFNLAGGSAQVANIITPPAPFPSASGAGGR